MNTFEQFRMRLSRAYTVIVHNFQSTITTEHTLPQGGEKLCGGDLQGSRLFFYVSVSGVPRVHSVIHNELVCRIFLAAIYARPDCYANVSNERLASYQIHKREFAVLCDI